MKDVTDHNSCLLKKQQDSSGIKDGPKVLNADKPNNGSQQLKVAFCQKDLDNFFISQKIFRFSTLDLSKLLRPGHDVDKILIISGLRSAGQYRL